MFENLAPPYIREFLPYISPKAIQVLPIAALMKQAIEISPRMVSGEGRDSLIEKLSPHLPQGIKVTSTHEHPNLVSLSQLSPETKKRAGQLILAIYFCQLKNSDQLFLDLRSQHFAWDTERHELLWHPTSFWAQLESPFLNAVLDLYSGFYNDEPEKRLSALSTLGLTGHEQQLKDHFGKGLNGPILFKISHLAQSFHEIFSSLHAEGKQIHPHFALLGIYITSLYLTLESLGVELDARKAYLGSSS
jgi:hypothetical protein